MLTTEGLAWFLAKILHGIPTGTLKVLERMAQPPEAGNGCVGGLLRFSVLIRGKGKEIPKYHRVSVLARLVLTLFSAAKAPKAKQQITGEGENRQDRAEGGFEMATLAGIYEFPCFFTRFSHNSCWPLQSKLRGRAQRWVL